MKGKLFIRLKLAFGLLTGKYKHFVLINVDDENFIKIIEDKTFDCEFIYSGCRPYLYFKMIKKVAASKDEIETMLDKAQFEADAEEYRNTKK